MTIVLTGGGTGGHITPILAVAHELKRLNPDVTLIYISERNGKFSHLTKDNPDIDHVYGVFAGKFRRYHGESWLKRLLAVKTNLQNIRDGFYVVFGIVQSWFLLGRLKPDVLFQKGSFAGMPVGIAAAVRRIALVTHDSDIVPGLANRVLSRWAKFNATGMPTEYYNYPKERARHVGVLVTEAYMPVTPDQMRSYRAEIGLPTTSRLLFITGGSQGSRMLNLPAVKVIPKLLQQYPDLYVVHQVGRGNRLVYGEYHNPRLQVLEFLGGMHRYSGAADIVVTRAGANTLTEFGVQGKACIVVPNPLLAGGHQLKNTEYLLQQGAILSIDEKQLKKQPQLLADKVAALLLDNEQREALAKKLQAITIPDATHRVAQLLLEAAV